MASFRPTAIGLRSVPYLSSSPRPAQLLSVVASFPPRAATFPVLVLSPKPQEGARVCAASSVRKLRLGPVPVDGGVVHAHDQFVQITAAR